MSLQPQDERVPPTGDLADANRNEQKSANETNDFRVATQPRRSDRHPLRGERGDEKGNAEAHAVKERQYRAAQRRRPSRGRLQEKDRRQSGTNARGPTQAKSEAERRGPHY